MKTTERDAPESLLKRMTILIVPMDIFPKGLSALNALLLVLLVPDQRTMNALCAPLGLSSHMVNAPQPIVMVCVKETHWLQTTKR